MKARRLDQMSAAERAEFDAAYAATKLALEVGDQVRSAREAAGLTQRELASRTGTSQAALTQLEAGGIGTTVTTLQNVATALNLKVSLHLGPET